MISSHRLVTHIKCRFTVFFSLFSLSLSRCHWQWYRYLVGSDHHLPWSTLKSLSKSNRKWAACSSRPRPSRPDHAHKTCIGWTEHSRVVFLIFVNTHTHTHIPCTVQNILAYAVHLYRFHDLCSPLYVWCIYNAFLLYHTV